MPPSWHSSSLLYVVGVAGKTPQEQIRRWRLACRMFTAESSCIKPVEENRKKKKEARFGRGSRAVMQSLWMPQLTPQGILRTSLLRQNENCWSSDPVLASEDQLDLSDLHNALTSRANALVSPRHWSSAVQGLPCTHEVLASVPDPR